MTVAPTNRGVTTGGTADCACAARDSAWPACTGWEESQPKPRRRVSPRVASANVDASLRDAIPLAERAVYGAPVSEVRLFLSAPFQADRNSWQDTKMRDLATRTFRALDDFTGHMVEAFKLRGAATKLGYTRGPTGMAAGSTTPSRRFPACPRKFNQAHSDTSTQRIPSLRAAYRAGARWLP